MQEKLQDYISTLERLSEAATDEDRPALAFAIEKGQQELQRVSLELYST